VSFRAFPEKRNFSTVLWRICITRGKPYDSATDRTGRAGTKRGSGGYGGSCAGTFRGGGVMFACGAGRQCAAVAEHDVDVTRPVWPRGAMPSRVWSPTRGSSWRQPEQPVTGLELTLQQASRVFYISQFSGVTTSGFIGTRAVLGGSSAMASQPDLNSARAHRGVVRATVTADRPGCCEAGRKTTRRCVALLRRCGRSSKRLHRDGTNLDQPKHTGTRGNLNDLSLHPSLG